MADLDSFFAMKDKKKKKGKEKKFAKTTSTSMAKTLEATETPPTKPDKEAKTDVPIGPSSQSQEDEWREQEEETQDLEGLKVQALRLDGEERPQQRTDTGEPAGNPDDNEEVEFGEDKMSAASSAWQKMSSTPIVTESSEPVVVETKPTSSGVYVPPSRRQGGITTGGRRPLNAPPDIQNASAFPSLQASLQSQPTGKEKAIDKDFKEVKSSKGSRSADSQYEAPSLELTNKYSALRSN